MLHINKLSDGLVVFDALSTQLRLDIVELLLKHGELNINDIAKYLNITNGALTSHIKKLSEAGIIEINTSPGIRGSQKVCSLKISKIIVDIVDENSNIDKSYLFDIKIGTYSSYKVSPTCGLVTQDNIIGELDDTRYFDFPERYEASLIWFTKGFLEYKIPNKLKPEERPVELQIAVELASEAPGSSTYYPSDIYFSINDVELGYWTAPGEFTDRPGIFTPKWWFPNLGQYGRLKMISVNKKGTFIDGLKISDVTIGDLDINYQSTISLVISCPEHAKHKGGVTIFGNMFGDYNHGIKVTVIYE